jgi:hypothetical protein
MESLEQFAMMLESNPMLLVAISLWEALWTLIALWFAGRRNQKIWFLVCGLTQIFGLIEIIYLATQTNFFKKFNFNNELTDTEKILNKLYE